MDVKKLGPEELNICTTYLVTEISSFDDLLGLYSKYQQEYKHCTIIITLDDLGQAQYTSMHAKLTHDLEETDGHDLSKLPPDSFEDGEHKGYLSSPSEFFICEHNFRNKLKEVSFTDACQRGVTIDDQEVELLEEIHQNPLSFIDAHVHLSIVPVEDPSLGICAFPNGYFTCDLNPLENYFVAKCLHEKFGYKLLGIGASLIGFLRECPLTKAEAALLAEDLAKLYNTEPNTMVITRLATLSTQYNYLFLKYVEYLE